MGNSNWQTSTRRAGRSFLNFGRLTLGYSPCLHRRVSYPTSKAARPAIRLLDHRESEKPAGRYRENVGGEDRGALDQRRAVCSHALSLRRYSSAAMEKA
jgi:hypothetical protein